MENELAIPLKKAIDLIDDFDDWLYKNLPITATHQLSINHTIDKIKQLINEANQ